MKKGEKRGEIKSDRFPASLFWVYLIVLFLMSGFHTGIIVLANTLEWNKIIQVVIAILYWSFVAVGLTLFTRNKIQKIMDINVGGTKNIIEKCLEHPECKKMVYVSSSGAIPELPKGQKIREVKQFDSEKVVGWYSKTKAMATQAVLDAVKKEGLNACVVHPSGILGPQDYAIGETTGTIIKIINGEMPVGMRGSFNLCDVRDLAAGCIAAADKGRTGECYILGNEEVTLKEMCELLDKDLHCGTCKLYLPLGLAKLLAKQMEKKAEKTGKKALMTTFSVYNLERNNTFDYSKAKKELGYHTRSYAETLHDEAVWLKEEGKIG